MLYLCCHFTICLQVVDAKTGQEVTEESETAAGWADEYEKFRAAEADEWVKELTSEANIQKVCNPVEGLLRSYQSSLPKGSKIKIQDRS